MAIEEWSELQHRETVCLERALAAFDLFVLKDRQGDFEEVKLKREHPPILWLTILDRHAA